MRRVGRAPTTSSTANATPSLHSSERRFALTLGPVVLSLFVGGMLFCYFLLLPAALKLLINFGAPVIRNEVRAADYLSFVTTFILGMGIVLAVPVVTFAVIRLHVVSRGWLAKQRRYVFLLSVVLGALITSTQDPFNQALVALPIYFLYELGMLLGRLGGGVEPRVEQVERAARADPIGPT